MMTQHQGSARPERIAVVGVDFSDAGDDAIRWGLRWLSDSPEKRLHLTYVLDPRAVIYDAATPVMVTEERVLAHAPKRLTERLEAVALLAGVRVEHEKLASHVRIGRPVETLLQVCTDYEADVLVVGTHSRRGMERLLLGSVAEALVRRSHCPVMVARPVNYLGCEKTARPEPATQGLPAARAKVPHEPISSTQSDSWRPSDSGPTGFRIV